MTLKQLQGKVKRLQSRLHQAEQALYWARINLREAQDELAARQNPPPKDEEKVT